MTKKLQEIFNLADPTEPTVDSSALPVPDVEQHRELIADVDQAIDKIDQALSAVRDLDASDHEMDQLAKLAEEKFEEIFLLGMNVEPRFSGQILQTATALLGHALTAKQNKLEKRLKIIELQLKKARLDQMQDKKSAPDDELTGQAMVLDRTELLRVIAESKHRVDQPKKTPEAK
jgi:hypothetical protein